MPFFDPPPPPPEPLNLPTEPPEGRFVPGVVPLEQVLARNEQAAIVLRALSVFPDGIAIELDSYVRHPPETIDFAEFGGFGGFGASRGVSLEVTARARPKEDDADDDDRDTEKGVSAATTRPSMPFPPFHGMWGHSLRFGVQFPDGTKVTTLKPYVPEFDFEHGTEEPTYGLDGGGGGGSNSHYQHTFFVWPLPTPGTLTMVCEWPEYDIAETATALDLQPILDAARRAQPLWPEDADRPSHRNGVSFMAAFRRHAERGDLSEE